MSSPLIPLPAQTARDAAVGLLKRTPSDGVVLHRDVVLEDLLRRPVGREATTRDEVGSVRRAPSQTTSLGHQNLGLSQ